MAIYEQYPGWGQYMVTGYVEVGIWKRVGGVWALAASESVYVQEDVGSQGYHTVSWSLQNTYSLGGGVEAFGATVQNQDGNGAAVTYLAASWTVTAASGERSATPSGQLTTVTVRPI